MSGWYTFSTVSDDGVILSVCPDAKGLGCYGSALINNWSDHAPTENSSGPVYLAAGSHQIVLDYYENVGGATLQLFWSGPNIAKQIIPGIYLNAAFWGG